MPSKPEHSQQPRRLGIVVALVLLALYYAAVFRPLVEREQAQNEPFDAMQKELRTAATNNPAISGLSLTTLDRLQDTLLTSITNTTLARELIAKRFTPEPSIATNLTQPFQLSDYQNERLSRGDRLISFAGERKVKITPAVTGGLPEYTFAENTTPELLWGQLALVDGVLRAAVEAGVSSIEDVSMPEPLLHSPTNSITGRLVELPLRIELVGTTESLARWLGLVLLDAEGRGTTKLPVVEGLPAACLEHIILRKETTDQPGLVRTVAQLNGFLRLPPASQRPFTGANSPN